MRIAASVVVALLFLIEIVPLKSQFAPEREDLGRTSVSNPDSVTLTTPLLINVSGVLKDQVGQPRNGLLGLTFGLYKAQDGGTPLWLETQNVQIAPNGQYEALLGSVSPDGVPLSLFTTTEARWIGVRVLLPGVDEEPRIQLVSVPYALKAGDADTLGGKPLSAFLMAPEGDLTVETHTPERLSKLSDTSKLDSSAGPQNGTEIVSNPTSTQSINAPAKAGVIPLQLKGHPRNGDNILEIFDSQPDRALGSFFDSRGALVTSQPPTFATQLPGSIAFAGAGGVLSQDNQQFFWNEALRTVHFGPRSGFDSEIIPELAHAVNSVTAINPPRFNILSVFGQTDSAEPIALNAIATAIDDTHSSGTKLSIDGLDVSTYHSGSGPTTGIFGSAIYAAQKGPGEATNVIGVHGEGSFGDYIPTSRPGNVTNVFGFRSFHSAYGATGVVSHLGGFWVASGTKSGSVDVTNNYGIKVDDQRVGTNNWALLTGKGKVQIGDTLVADKNLYAAFVVVPFSPALTIDANLGNSFKIILSDDATSFSITNPNTGQIITLVLCQDAIGNHTMSWPTNLKLGDGTFALTMTPNKCVTWTGLYDGGNWYEVSRTVNM
ncbi:MAG: hypothetical protein HY651_09245 [Acidobacteria bacterium]|nr:hypothetical protein [Acidobacteriota bacterium]